VTPHPTPPTAADPLLGRVLDGRYRIEAFLARGGMATIYRGADLRLDRTVAVKVMHPSFASDPGFVERFEREARAAARLNSPYAVAVHDQGNDGGVTYLVMEYVPGHTVRDVLRTHGALDPGHALAILDPVLEALAAAHRAGYIHRDVKPENVLISDDGRVKVTDFGLARAIEGGDTGRTHGLLLGTVAYLSPEQVEHDQTDARSDVYSAGILLFELITGQVPFTAAAPMQVAYKHVHEDVPAPSSLRPEVPAGIDALVGRATRRDATARFPDAAAFLAEVREQRRALPPVAAWSPTPTDTIVVATGARAAGQEIDAPAWVNGERSAAPQVAAAAGIAAGTAGAAIGAPGPPPPPAGTGPAPGGMSHPSGPLPVPGSPWPPATSTTEATHRTAPDAGGGRARRGRKGLWLGLVALASVAALLVLLFGPLQQVAVPDVLGKTPTEAATILATSNLLLDAEEEAYSEEYAKGLIVATDPTPDGRLRTGGTVQAVVSLGPERYDVPALRRLTLEEAQVALGAANLVVGDTTEAFDDKVRKGRIISSTPEAGTSVKRDTPVDLRVSKGPEPVELPELVGTDAAEAVATLEKAGLEVDRSEEFSESVAKDLVISTSPKGGATVYRGDTVGLVVSKGPPLVTVPRVVGLSESAARAELEAAGFRVSVNKPLGTAIFGVNSQNPRGGTEAPKGSTVTISVV
jgi:eukaryotic-like serine/threonine-protein kinase